MRERIEASLSSLYIVAGDAYARNFGSDASSGAGACGVKKWKKYELGF